MERPLSVLVIDDNEDARHSLSLILSKEGFHVREAANGHQALALHREMPVDIVVTDIFMPEKDGIETIHELRQRDPRVHIVVISGSEPARLERLGVVINELGVEIVLRKPADPRAVIEAIKATTGHPRRS